ncbi:hypothetical protein [Acidithiobacillus ferrooxidans]|jgi:hypothetical protein|nr:hypothetical protein [Acidithiobacillus ferrooxidans]
MFDCPDLRRSPPVGALLTGSILHEGFSDDKPPDHHNLPEK